MRSSRQLTKLFRALVISLSAPAGGAAWISHLAAHRGSMEARRLLDGMMTGVG